MREKLSILVIDDDHHQRTVLRLHLEDFGHTVVEAGDGREGLARCAEHRPDLILTDLDMPGMSGYTLIRELSRTGMEIPVVVVSGSGQLRDAVAAVRAGAWDYVTRPFATPDELELTIRRVHERSRLLTENRNVRLHLEELVEQRTRELRDSETRFRTLFSSANDAILLLRDARIITVNRRAIELFACSYNELIDRTLATFSPVRQPDGTFSGKRLGTLLDEALAGPPHCFEWQLVRHDGRPLTAEISLNSLLLHDRPHLQAVIRDIGERKRLEERLGHTQRLEAIGRLSAGVAHDFNNMLTAISGYAQLADWRFGTENDELHVCLNEIQLAAARAARMTEGLLAFSRKRAITPTLVDLNRVVRNMEKMLQRLIAEETTLATRLCDDPLPVMADVGQIDQILLNLVTNAHDAVPPGGRIDIATTLTELDHQAATRHEEVPPGTYAQLTVSDNGCGMSEETRRHIFEPFYSTKGGNGTGLGLAIVYGAVRQHKGVVTVESTAGQGTTFRIWLPLASGTQERAESGEPVLQDSIGGSETILIAEDSPTVLEIIRDTLESFGYRVLTAEDGEQALAVLAAQPAAIDLAILDVVMPKLGGPALARKLRALKPELKLIFMSGYPPADVAGQLDELDGESILSKPLTPFRLLQQLRLVLDAG